MKKKWTKIIAVLAVAVVAVCTLVFTACGESGSETYVGAVSAESYNSKDAMLEAFVNTELNGNATTASYVSYEEEKELDETEIENLGLPEEAQAGLKSVEKVNVKYSYSVSAVARDTYTAWKGVYVLNYGETYKYFTPAVSSGETLTRSYYDSVFDAENYKNVTMTFKQVVQSKVTAQGQSVTVKAEVSYVFKITEEAVSLEMTTIASMSGSGMPAMKNTETLTAYLVEGDGGLLMAASIDGSEWYAGSTSELNLEFNSIEDIYKSTVYEWLDQSYFVKTNNGFKIDEEKMDLYIDNALAENEQLQGYLGELGLTIKADSNFIVREGNIYKSTAAVTINGNMTQSGVTMKMAVSSSTECVYTDYGTTTVTIPSGANAALGRN